MNAVLTAYSFSAKKDLLAQLLALNQQVAANINDWDLDEGSIPFTRSIENQRLPKECSKSAVNSSCPFNLYSSPEITAGGTVEGQAGLRGCGMAFDEAGAGAPRRQPGGVRGEVGPRAVTVQPIWRLATGAVSKSNSLSMLNSRSRRECG